MRIYTGRHGTRVSMGPFTALLFGMFIWPVQILWHLFRLMIPIAVIAVMATWRITAFTVRWAVDGGKILWGEFHHHDETRDLG